MTKHDLFAKMKLHYFNEVSSEIVGRESDLESDFNLLDDCFRKGLAGEYIWVVTYNCGSFLVPTCDPFSPKALHEIRRIFLNRNEYLLQITASGDCVFHNFSA